VAAGFIEIERKFLVLDPWPTAEKVCSIKQLYLDSGGALSVRLRDTDGQYSLTLKSGIKPGMRNEFDIDVPLETGAALYALHLTAFEIVKQRHNVRFQSTLWEIDVFEGGNAGLIVAEVELDDEHGAFEKPDWLGPEITHDKRFTNHALSRNPFTRWGVSYQDILAELGA
jgi:adenylate cyclase